MSLNSPLLTVAPGTIKSVNSFTNWPSILLDIEETSESGHSSAYQRRHSSKARSNIRWYTVSNWRWAENTFPRVLDGWPYNTCADGGDDANSIGDKVPFGSVCKDSLFFFTSRQHLILRGDDETGYHVVFEVCFSLRPKLDLGDGIFTTSICLDIWRCFMIHGRRTRRFLFVGFAIHCAHFSDVMSDEHITLVIWGKRQTKCKMTRVE